MIFWIYQVGVHCALPFVLMKMLWERVRHGKHRSSLWLRVWPPLPSLPETGRKRIWLHGVSVGEVRAVAALARELSEYDLIVSTVTETGLREAKRSIPQAIVHTLLPLDLFWSVNRLVGALKPEQMILAEGDHWPAFQRAAGSVSVASGKLSERSYRRLKRAPMVARLLYDRVDKFCMQNAEYAKRLRDLGVEEARVVVTGNLKYDAPVSQVADESAWREELGIREGERVVVLGSTHNPEEEWLLDRLKRLDNIRVLVVPRHPERFSQVAALLHLRGESYFRLSTGGEGRVVLIDTMGKLRDCYQIADVAIVAGSFVAHVGGHNLLEPCDYGVPVLFGPHTETQKEMRDLVLEAGAGLEVSLDELAEAVERVDSESGSKGLALMKGLRGSVKRTLEATGL